MSHFHKPRRPTEIIVWTMRWKFPCIPFYHPSTRSHLSFSDDLNFTGCRGMYYNWQFYLHFGEKGKIIWPKPQWCPLPLPLKEKHGQLHFINALRNWKSELQALCMVAHKGIFYNVWNELFQVFFPCCYNFYISFYLCN